ncbi:MAG: hypothetical protein HYV96_16465 [Opitutae bacterium]|nr:hypothetical protein [Opitutae bacterium]
MKPTLFILLLGLLAGLAAHVGWYHWRRAAVPGNDDVVSWMKTDLQLTEEQFDRIHALHDRTGPQLREFAAQAARMRAEFEAFERVRRTEGRVDFLAFARCLEMWRRIDRDWSDTTRELIAATAGELTPDQRARYLTRLTPAPTRSVN